LVNNNFTLVEDFCYIIPYLSAKYIPKNMLAYKEFNVDTLINLWGNFKIPPMPGRRY